MKLKKIIVISDGGLANRIRPIFSALALAEVLGLAHRDVSVYWRPSPVCDTLLTDVILTPFNEESERFIGSLDKQTAFLYREGSVRNAVNVFQRADIANLLEQCSSQSIEKAQSIEKYICNSTNNFHTLILFDNQPLIWNPKLSGFYHENLKKLVFIRDIEESAALFLGTKKLHRDSLGVHARGTDFRIPFSEYSKKISLENLSETWFFASDSDYFNREAVRLYKNVTLRKKSLPDHKAGILGFGERIFRSSQSITDAAVDLRILASINLKIFHPNSTFACLAKEIACSKFLSG